MKISDKHIQILKLLSEKYSANISFNGEEIIIEKNQYNSIIIKCIGIDDFGIKYKSSNHIFRKKADEKKLFDLVIQNIDDEWSDQFFERSEITDFEEFKRTEADYITNGISKKLQENDKLFDISFNSNRYIVEYYKGLLIIWDDPFFDTTMPLLIEFNELKC